MNRRGDSAGASQRNGLSGGSRHPPRGGGRGGGSGGSGPGRREYGGSNAMNGSVSSASGRNGSHEQPPFMSNAQVPFSGPKGKWSNGPPQFKDQKSSAASASLLHSAAPNFKEQEDRLAFLGVSLVGCRVIAELKDGKQYEGILHTMNTTNEIGAVLRMARLITNGKAGGNAVDRLVLTSSDILGISAYSVNLSTEESSTQDNLGFLTDAAIGARAGEFGRERELVQWQPSASDPITAGSLEDGEDGKWDQFSTNERLFGVTTDFNEELYTTAIDRSAPDFKQKEAEARRMAREIENETKMSDNIHILEERNIVVPNDGMDEEEKYSSVIRQPGKYVPPGARVTGGKNVGALPPRKRSEASTVATAATSNAGGGSSNPAPSSASGALTAEAASSSSKVVPTAPSKPSESSESSDSASKAPSVVVTKPAVSDVTAPKQETSSPAKPVATTKLSDKDQLRKAELLAKFALKARPGEASGRDTNKLIGEAWQQFHSFANQERKQAAPRYRDKSQVFSDLKSFSKEFKLKTPVPADLEPLLAKKPADKAKTTVTPPSVPSSVSSLKPTTAVSRTKTESKTPPSPALLQAKAHALALAATLPNLSRLKDRSASDVSFPASSSAPAPPAAPAPSPAPVATQTPQAPAVQPAPPTPASEGDNASTISAAATDSDSQKFKLNVSAVEFNPTFGNPPAGQNSGSGSPPNGGLKSPAQGERQRPASVSGSTRGSSNTRNGSYSKAGYPKTPGGKPGPGQPGWSYGQPQQFRPPFPVQPYDDGSGAVFVGAPMDGTQQYFAYPMPGPYAQFARVPMVPRPYMPGMPPQVVAGPGMPAYIPYGPFPAGVPAGYVPPMMPGAQVRVYAAGAPPPPGPSNGNSKPGTAPGQTGNQSQPAMGNSSPVTGGNGTAQASSQSQQPQQPQAAPPMIVYARPPDGYPHMIAAGAPGGPRPPMAGAPYIPSPQMYPMHPQSPGMVPGAYPPPEFYQGQPIMMAHVWPAEAVHMQAPLPGQHSHAPPHHPSQQPRPPHGHPSHGPGPMPHHPQPHHPQSPHPMPLPPAPHHQQGQQIAQTGSADSSTPPSGGNGGGEKVSK